MARIHYLHQESLTLKVRDHSDMLSSAQYLVNCVEGDHVCHGITTQEPRCRPMKETLHSRHHSTVLPRLGASNKERLQNLHTQAVDLPIQLLGNKRVLKDRSPPIADEEQRLIRRQRYTLSQQPPTAGLQAQGVRRTKLHLYLLWSFATRRETLVRLQRTADGLVT